MLDIANDIQSLSTFKRETTKVMKRLRKTGKPIVLTVNGKAEVVVQDAAAYQRLLEEFARLERDEMRLFLEASREDMLAGRTRPADEVFADLGKKS